MQCSVISILLNNFGKNLFLHSDKYFAFYIAGMTIINLRNAIVCMAFSLGYHPLKKQLKEFSVQKLVKRVNKITLGDKVKENRHISFAKEEFKR